MTNDRAISAEDPPNPDAHSDVRLGQQWAQQLALPDGHAPGPQAFRWGVCVCASKTPQDAQWFVGSWLRSFGNGARAMGMFGEEELAPSWSSGEGCPVPAVVALEVLEQRAVRWAPGGAEPGGGRGQPDPQQPRLHLRLTASGTPTSVAEIRGQGARGTPTLQPSAGHSAVFRVQPRHRVCQPPPGCVLVGLSPPDPRTGEEGCRVVPRCQGGG